MVIIIPARGSSKTIPAKNIRNLCGKPLLSYTVEAAINSKVTDYVFVSTDSEEVARIAKKSGAQVIARPKNISHGSASTESALIHALKVIKRKDNLTPELVLTLPPTSPLRKPQTIRKFVSYYLRVSSKYDAMVSLSETRDDYWINERGRFRRLFPQAPRRRQDRKPVYLENSAIYITKTRSLIATHSILGKRCTAFIINPIEAVDINKLIDLEWAEFILTRSLNK